MGIQLLCLYSQFWKIVLVHVRWNHSQERNKLCNKRFTLFLENFLASTMTKLYLLLMTAVRKIKIKLRFIIFTHLQVLKDWPKLYTDIQNQVHTFLPCDRNLELIEMKKRKRESDNEQVWTKWDECLSFLKMCEFYYYD